MPERWRQARAHGLPLGVTEDDEHPVPFAHRGPDERYDLGGQRPEGTEDQAGVDELLRPGAFRLAPSCHAAVRIRRLASAVLRDDPVFLRAS